MTGARLLPWKFPYLFRFLEQWRARSTATRLATKVRVDHRGAAACSWFIGPVLAALRPLLLGADPKRRFLLGATGGNRRGVAGER
jgi:hypothetical protein